MLGGGTPGQPPSNFANLEGWWKADEHAYSTDDTVLAVDGAVVVQWKDQSGNSRHLTDGVGPLFETNEVNGYPVLRFDGVNDVLVSTAVASDFVDNNLYTIFVAVKMAANSDGILYFDDNIAAQNAISLAADGNSDIQLVNYDGSSDSIVKAGTMLSTWHIVTAMHSGGNILVGLTDTRDASLGSAASGNTSVLTQVLNVGRNRGAFGAMDLAELIIFDVALSESDRQQIEMYLAHKYAITLPY